MARSRPTTSRPTTTCSTSSPTWGRRTRSDSGRSVFLREQLRLRLAVGEECVLLAAGPRCPLIRTFDVPVGTATLQCRAQIESELIDGRPAEEPVAVVDLVDAQPRLEHH